MIYTGKREQQALSALHAAPNYAPDTAELSCLTVMCLWRSVSA